MAEIRSSGISREDMVRMRTRIQEELVKCGNTEEECQEQMEVVLEAFNGLEKEQEELKQEQKNLLECRKAECSGGGEEDCRTCRKVDNL